MSFYGNKFMYYENTSYEDTMNFFQESYENIQIFFDDIILKMHDTRLLISNRFRVAEQHIKPIDKALCASYLRRRITILFTS